MKFVFGRVKNILGKQENAAFHPFPTMFSKGFFCVCVCVCVGGGGGGGGELWGRELMLSNDVILDWSKLKSYAFDKFNVAKIMISFSFWVEKIIGIWAKDSDLATVDHYNNSLPNDKILDWSNLKYLQTTK